MDNFHEFTWRPWARDARRNTGRGEHLRDFFQENRKRRSVHERKTPNPRRVIALDPFFRQRMRGAPELLQNGLGLPVALAPLLEIIFARLKRGFRRAGLHSNAHVHLHLVAQPTQGVMVIRGPALYELPQHILTLDDGREAERNDSGLRKDTLQNSMEGFDHFGRGFLWHVRGEIRKKATQHTRVDPPYRRACYSALRSSNLALMFCDAVCEHKFLIRSAPLVSTSAGVCRACWQRRLCHVAQRRFDGADDEVQAEINQIHPRQRQHQIATNDHACIEHVIDQIQQGQICGFFIANENNLGSLRRHRSIRMSPVAKQTKMGARGRYIRLASYFSIFSNSSGRGFPVSCDPPVSAKASCEIPDHVWPQRTFRLPQLRPRSSAALCRNPAARGWLDQPRGELTRTSPAGIPSRCESFSSARVQWAARKPSRPTPPCPVCD